MWYAKGFRRDIVVLVREVLREGTHLQYRYLARDIYTAYFLEVVQWCIEKQFGVWSKMTSQGFFSRNVRLQAGHRPVNRAGRHRHPGVLYHTPHPSLFTDGTRQGGRS